MVRFGGFTPQYLNDLQTLLNDPTRLVFVDESSFNTAMSRRFARSPKGERVTTFLPRNQGKNQSLICALCHTGPEAAFVFEGTVDGDAFVWYVEHVLCPCLKKGQVVFLDHLSAHDRTEAVDLIEEGGCEVQYLPRYSPDLNPIEMLFSKVKALVRGGNWRALEDLWKVIGTAPSTVSLKDVWGWYTAAYPSLLL
ncbi:IS630 family transposase [Deinococcus ruber]|uniref:IS630 family transposase n=1 Tax=Deinococcus ruber TaxID=1848197 RepID=UPI00227D8A25|nr:IS630 family transposase [Deinococcus ruber]